MLARAEHLKLLDRPLFPDWPDEESADELEQQEEEEESDEGSYSSSEYRESEIDYWSDDDSADGEVDSDSDDSYSTRHSHDSSDTHKFSSMNTNTITTTKSIKKQKKKKKLTKSDKWKRSLEVHPDWITEHLIYSISEPTEKELFDIVYESDTLRDKVSWNDRYAISDTNCAVRGSLLHHCVYHKRYDLVERLIDESKLDVNLGIEICEKRKRASHQKKKNRYYHSSHSSSTLASCKSDSDRMFSSRSFTTATETSSSSISTLSSTSSTSLFDKSSSSMSSMGVVGSSFSSMSYSTSSCLTSIPSSEPVDEEDLLSSKDSATTSSLLLPLSGSDSSREQSPTTGGYSSSYSSVSSSTLGGTAPSLASSVSLSTAAAGPTSIGGSNSRSSSIGPMISPTVTMSPRSPLPCVMTCDIIDNEIRCQKSEPEESEMIRTTMICVHDRWHSFSNEDTVLHMAIKMKDVRMVRLLLKNHRMNIRSVNINNNTPVLTAIICGKREIFDCILNRLTFSCGKDLSFAELLRDYLCNIWDHYRKTGSIDLSTGSVSPSRR